ncbi:MAG: Fe-S cluster assembly protein SufD, partial [Pseudomonadota bacterium]
MAAPATEMDLTEARIADLSLPTGGWTEAARTDALARLRHTGLPQRRDEYWKFTRPDMLTQVGAQAAVF